jgi:hypothetical protein
MHHRGDESARGAWPRLSMVAVLVLVIGLGAITAAWGAAAVPGACAAISVVRENARAGATGWEPPVTTALPSVQGYANTTSAVCGQRVTLYLGTRSTRPILVRIVAWRLGYYRGTGGRRVWTSAVVRVLRPKTWEAVAPGTNTVTAPWRPSLSFTIPHTWTQGVYELRLVPLGGGRHPGAIPLVVRDATHTTKLVEVLSTNTWQMYNTWGGVDAYSMPRTSRIVSLNRPYDGFGMVSLAGDDYPLVRFVELHGLDVSYVTDPDLDRGVSAVGRAHALVFGSHTEYWTTGMRATLTAALARGANAVFLGANNMYWRPVPVGTSRPYRALAIWKLAALDPNANSPQLASLKWRDAPINQPEQALLGEQFGCTDVLEPMTVPSPLGWLFAGSGATPGQSLAGVIYQETDTPGAGSMPAGTRVVTSLSFACPQDQLTNGGSAVTLAPGSGGGLVVDVGTRGWVCLLNRSCVSNPVYSWPALVNRDPDIVVGTVRNDSSAAQVIQNVTITILDAVLAGPAGKLVASSGYPLAGS